MPHDSRRETTTQWTLIRRAQGQGADARAALGTLISRYQESIVGIIRHHRHPPNQTPEEIKQDFLTGVIARGDVLKLDPGTGKFRAWLAVAVRRHLHNLWDAWWAQRNPARQTDYPDAFDVSTSDTAERVLLQKFAVETLRHAEERLRASVPNPARLEAIRGFLPGPDMRLDDARVVGERLGLSPYAFRKTIHDHRKRFAECLRDAVADTLQLDPGDPSAKAAIDRELSELRDSLWAPRDTSVVLG